MSIRYVFIVLTLGLAVSGCGSFTTKKDITQKWSADKLYTEARNSLNLGDYETAVDYYEKLESRFPFGKYAEQAQLEIAYAYYKYDEPDSAIAAADRFIKLHPRSPNVDYAYYLKGLTSFSRDKGFVARYLPRDHSQRDPAASRQAFDDFAELVERFPESRYREDSIKRMRYLRNVIAKHEIHVADFYMRRGAYVAAANRAKGVVENYQRTPSVPDALVLMAKAYNKLGVDDLSAEAIRVLKLNFPEHPDVKEVEALALKN